MTFTELFAVRLGDLSEDYSSNLVEISTVANYHYILPSAAKVRELYRYLDELIDPGLAAHELAHALMTQLRWTMAYGYLPEMLALVENILRELGAPAAKSQLSPSFSEAQAWVQAQLLEILRMLELNSRQPILEVAEVSFKLATKTILKNSLAAGEELSKLLLLRNSLWSEDFSPKLLEAFRDELLTLRDAHKIPPQLLAQNLTRFEELLSGLEVEVLWENHTVAKLGAPS